MRPFANTALGAVLIGAGLTIPAMPAVASTPTCEISSPDIGETVTCTGSWEDYYSGGSTWGDQAITVTIPRGATSLTLDLKGAGGGTYPYVIEDGKTYVGSAGGTGARVQATLDVTGMSTLTVVIGTGGRLGFSSGANGGRFSAVYEGTSTTAADVLLVAGGGGGGASPYPGTADCAYTFGSGCGSSYEIREGGDGAADNTAAGGSSRSFSSTWFGGGGDGGVGGEAGYYPDATDPGAGSPGASWSAGGAGGAYGSLIDGYGGGGGWGYGGGSGGAGDSIGWYGSYSLTGPGGAGGSFADASATSVSYSPAGGASGIERRPEDGSSSFDSWGDWGSASLAFTGSAPAAPTSVAATAGDQQAEVSWTAPTAGGRGTADSYTVTASPGGAQCTSTSSSSTPSCTVTGLTNGTSYTFTVAATNSAGSATSSASAAVTPGTTPSAPTGLSIASGDQQLVASFTAPADDGGFSITEYEYQVDGGTWQSTSSTSTSITIGSLTNGQTYAIKVRAVNSQGAGNASSEVNGQPESSATVPAAPVINSITPGNTQADVAFSAGSDGGATITNYEYSVDAGNWTALSPTDVTSPVTIGSLTNGQTYSIRIRAVNNQGESDASNAMAVTPGQAPLAPTIDSITPGSGSAVVAFTPGSDEGSAITDYEYRLDPNSTGFGAWESAATDSSPLTATGMTNGVSYGIEIRAVNALGQGAASAAQTFTPLGVPGVPTSPTMTLIPEGFRFNWVAPDANGSAITDYEFSSDAGANWLSLGGTSTSNVDITTTSTGAAFTLGTQYTITIRARNSVGAGSASEGVTGVPAGAPGAPPSFTISPGDEYLDLHWGSVDTNGAVLDDMEYTTDGGTAWTSLGTTGTTARINETSTGIDFVNGTTYTVQIRAVNGIGDGTASSAVSATPNAVPLAPYGISTTQGNTQISVTFTAPSDRGSAITDYEYQLDGGSWVSAGVTSSPVVITGLTNGQSYYIRIRAVNGNGAGAFSTQLIATPVAPEDIPSKTAGLEALPGAASLELTWQAASLGAQSITNYQYTTDGGTVWKSLGTSGTSATITTESDNTPLVDGTNYTVQIRAATSSDFGDASDSVQQTPGIPLAPTGVSSSWSDETTVDLTWTSGGDNGYAISEYRVVVTQLSSRTGTLMARSSGPGSYTTSSAQLSIPGLAQTSAYSVTITPRNTNGWGLSVTSSIGNVGSSSTQTPPAIIQQVGMPPSGSCADVVGTRFGSQTSIQGGWGQSWARWVNDGLGGAVCTRMLVYSNSQSRWVLAD